MTSSLIAYLSRNLAQLIAVDVEYRQHCQSADGRRQLLLRSYTAFVGPQIRHQFSYYFKALRDRFEQLFRKTVEVHNKYKTIQWQYE